MDPSTPSAASASPSDVKFLLHVLRNVRGKLDVNWDSVASAQSLKNSAVAKVRFGQIKKKLRWDCLDASSQASPQKPITVKKSRGKANSKDDPETPVKKRKTSTGKVDVYEDNYGSDIEKFKREDQDALDSNFDAENYFDADD